MITAVLIMFSRKRMRLSLRFFSCLAALYSKFSLRSPKARASFTASSSWGRRTILRWSSSSRIIRRSCSVNSLCMVF